MLVAGKDHLPFTSHSTLYKLSEKVIDRHLNINLELKGSTLKSEYFKTLVDQSHQVFHIKDPLSESLYMMRILID